MSLVVHAKVTDISVRWELADRIAGKANAPKQALESIFTGAMQALEKAANVSFQPVMKERVWEVISAQKLPILKEALLLGVCDNILGGFNDHQVAEMLAEHKATGFIKNPRYKDPINMAYRISGDAITQEVLRQAKIMSDEWVPEIIAAVKNEGIELPDPAN
ncbi:MAG: hypothetical protein Q8L98_03300 [Chlamydiales bacterium]|nr:hypothetical protein [Chlamydiales bacterium]